MNTRGQKFIQHILLGPIGYRYRTLIVAIISILVVNVFLAGNLKVWVMIMAAYTIFGFTGLECKWLTQLLSSKQ